MKHITHIIYSNGISGHEKAIIGMVNEKNKKFTHNLIFLTKNLKLKSQIVSKNIKLININIFKVNHLLLDFKKIVSEIKKSKPDLIHSHLVHADLIISLLKKMKVFNVPIVTTRPYQYNINKIDNLKHKLFYKYICKFDIEICISKEIQTLLIKNEKKKNTRVAYYGLPLPDKHIPKNNNSEINIVIVGRLLKWKGHLNFLTNYSQIVKKFNENTNHKIYIYGEGPERDKINKLIQSKKLTNVYLMGLESNTDKIFNDKSILIHTSKYEGFGLVIIEAFQYNLAVISSKLGAMKEAIQDRVTGTIYDINDIESFENALTYTFNNLKQIQQSGYESYLKYYNSKRMLTDYNNIYDEII